jgi:hypothetical protein
VSATPEIDATFDKLDLPLTLYRPSQLSAVLFDGVPVAQALSRLETQVLRFKGYLSDISDLELKGPIITPVDSAISELELIKLELQQLN